MEKKADRSEGKRRFRESDMSGDQRETGFLLRRRARSDRGMERSRAVGWLSMSLYASVATGICSFLCS